MALRPKVLCRYAGCGKAIDDYGYCEKHKEIAKRQEKRTVSAYKHLYGWQWQKIRARYLKENPLCVICYTKKIITPATVVDHIDPHKGDVIKFWDEDNYQSLCKSCHDYKTAKFDGGFNNSIKTKE